MSDVKCTNPTQRTWCFTLNNPECEDDLQLAELANKSVYLIVAREHWNTPGLTPHYQGYVEFQNPCRFTKVKKYFPRAHIEPRRGSRTQARQYCFKEDPTPDEYGQFRPDKSGARNDLLAVKNKLDEGITESTIADEHFGSWVRYQKSFNRYALLKNKRKAVERKVLWIHGPTGCGKTKLAYEKLPDAYWKQPGCKWWDGYEMEADVIIDDFRPDYMNFQFLLRLLDRYPMQVECKGGSVPWMARNIIITAPTSPTVMFAHCQEDINQLLRRLEVCEMVRG